jgi:ribosomal-protein-alanine acetyltransferase
VSDLRPARVDDLSRLAEIERACFGRVDAEDALAAELDRAWARLYVDDRGAALAGFVNLWRVADEVEVLFVATAPAWRRRGVARALLGYALRSARDEGAARALLEVRRSNEAAIALYRALGFEVVGERRGYYDDGEDALIMAAPL